MCTGDEWFRSPLRTDRNQEEYTSPRVGRPGPAGPSCFFLHVCWRRAMAALSWSNRVVRVASQHLTPRAVTLHPRVVSTWADAVTGMTPTCALESMPFAHKISTVACVRARP